MCFMTALCSASLAAHNGLKWARFSSRRKGTSAGFATLHPYCRFFQRCIRTSGWLQLPEIHSWKSPLTYEAPPLARWHVLKRHQLLTTIGDLHFALLRSFWRTFVFLLRIFAPASLAQSLCRRIRLQRVRCAAPAISFLRWAALDIAPRALHCRSCSSCA